MSERVAAVLAERQLPHEAGGVVERLVVARAAELAVEVAIVDAAVVVVLHLEVARGVVARARPGERVQQVEAARVALLDLELQRVVVPLAAAPRNLDLLEALDRPPRLQRRVLGRRRSGAPGCSRRGS